MIKHVTAIFIVALFSISISAQTVYPADGDTAFNHSSGIQTIVLDSSKVTSLTNLGMLWGFIKYYHADVAAGKYNMDAELFRVLPKVLAAKTRGEANEVMEQWVDQFGKPELCPTCRKIEKNEKVKLMPDYGHLFDTAQFPNSLVNKLTYIKGNRDTTTNHYYIVNDFGQLAFRHERDYDKSLYPDAGMRLLTLFRYWNIVQYFYPNRHLIGSDWGNVLTDLMPELCNAKNSSQYYYSCKKLIASIHDSHAQLGGKMFSEMASGYKMIPVKMNFVEDKMIVARYYDTLNIPNLLHIGDIVTKVNNIPVDTLIARETPYISASNYTDIRKFCATWGGPLFTTLDSSISLTISRDSKQHDISIKTMPFQKNIVLESPFVSDTGYKIIEGNIGYLYPGKLKFADLANVQRQFADTRAMIIDMRCHPSVYMTHDYGLWLKKGRSNFARLTCARIDIPGLIEYRFSPEIGNNDTTATYKGKMVIIVNSSTFSSGEYQAIAFASIRGAIVIGDTTSGADGDVCFFNLPGGITTGFSGLGVLYPDGTETQRVGVKIDKYVRPTIDGIRAGKDEQLEAAIKIINEGQ